MLENHEKNYYWTFKPNSAKKEIDYLGSVFHGNKSGEIDFNFEALHTGNTELVLNLITLMIAQVPSFLR